jgi:hypothetical protein
MVIKRVARHEFRVNAMIRLIAPFWVFIKSDWKSTVLVNTKRA